MVTREDSLKRIIENAYAELMLEKTLQVIESQPLFRSVKPGELKLGDIIREGPKLRDRIKVEKLSPCTGFKGRVHVNRSNCYDRIATVLIE